MEKHLRTSPHEIIKNIFYHDLEVRFTPIHDIHLKYWPGSIIRNNLLYATKQIPVENNLSLYDCIESIPLKESHPYYKELSGGFPKGYFIKNIQFAELPGTPLILLKNNIYRFTLTLIGTMATYSSYFIDAIKMMAERGIGHPITNFRLIDISEAHPLHAPHLLYIHGTDSANPLTMPINFTYNQVNRLKNKIRIQFITPVNLVQNREKKNREISFQDKQNGFPGFYQLVRSVTYRLVKLSALYSHTDDSYFTEEVQNQLEEWLMRAADALLIDANLKRVSVMSSPRKENDNAIKLHGYIGETVYHGNFEEFFSILLFGEGIGVGNDVTYGMGHYCIIN